MTVATTAASPTPATHGRRASCGAPRVPRRTRHSARTVTEVTATVLVTATDVLVVEVGEDFLVTGEIRFPRRLVRRVEVVPTLLLFADAVVHTSAGDQVRLQGLFRDQARQLADHLRS